MPVNELKKDQCAVFLGQQIAPLGSPTASISKLNTKHYKLEICYEFKVEQEYVEPEIGEDPNKLPTGASFAVLPIGAHRKGSVLINYSQEDTASDLLTVSLKFITEGVKGNHGS